MPYEYGIGDHDKEGCAEAIAAGQRNNLRDAPDENRKEADAHSELVADLLNVLRKHLGADRMTASVGGNITAGGASVHVSLTATRTTEAVVEEEAVEEDDEETEDGE